MNFFTRSWTMTADTYSARRNIKNPMALFGSISSESMLASISLELGSLNVVLERSAARTSPRMLTALSPLYSTVPSLLLSTAS